jgi:hypothetical protein
MVSSLQLRHEACEDRCHACGRGARIIRAFKLYHPIFKHSDGRIAEAGIYKSIIFALKSRLSLFRTAINIARRQK